MPRGTGGASAPSPSFASLEKTLDRAIVCLTTGPQSREARALLIEARRLRSVVANWRSIPPPAAVHEEMLDRVLQLSTSVGAAIPGSLAAINAAAVEPPPVSEEPEPESYALDFEPQLYSLENATNLNRRAAPVPAAGAPAARAAAPPPPAPPPSPSPPAPPPVATPEEPSVDEPTQAFSKAKLKLPPELEPESAGPAPWPVDEEPFASPPAPPTPIPPMPPERPSTPAPPRDDEPAPVQAATEEAPEPPDTAPAPARGARVITYEFDPEGDDLSVPRTQIAAHAVQISEPVDPLLVVLADAYSPRADAYRTMRRKLATNNPTARVLAVTSASPGEGKTVFAANLALTLREAARTRVLLIEANVRAPTLGKLLGFDTPECFLAQLKRHAEEPRAPWVVAEPLPKLHVMAIDPALPREPLLDQVSFSMGMERLKQAGYEYVVVDSPPVLGNLDCNVISDTVDAVILTALPLKSMRRQMRKAVEQLEPAPILGVVVLEA